MYLYTCHDFYNSRSIKMIYSIFPFHSHVIMEIDEIATIKKRRWNVKQDFKFASRTKWPVSAILRMRKSDLCFEKRFKIECEEVPIEWNIFLTLMVTYLVSLNALFMMSFEKMCYAQNTEMVDTLWRNHSCRALGGQDFSRCFPTQLINETQKPNSGNQ